MKISIVTPSYNSALYLESTIQSIQNQTYKQFEHIVVDGQSSDQTVDILKKYSCIRWSSEADHGQSHAINKGFEVAEGDILAWQNADDLYFPDTFEIVVNFFKNNPDIDIIYGKYQLIDAQGSWISDSHFIPWNKWLFAHNRFVPMQPTVFFRKAVIYKLGGLNEHLEYCMDVDFFARAVKHGFKFAGLPDMLGQFRVHQNSKTCIPLNESKKYKELRQVLGSNFNYSASDYLILKIIYSARRNISRPLRMKIFRSP